jgi:insulin-like growth factor-binding protein complex acid labile subunit
VQSDNIFSCVFRLLAFLLAIQSQYLINAINLSDRCWRQDRFEEILYRECALTTIQDNSFANLSYSFRTLYLSESMIETIEMQAFVGLNELEWLDLGENKLIGLPENVFVPLPNLEEISIRENLLTNFNFDIFANNKKLANVMLSSNKISTIGPIQHKGGFSIKILDLDNNELKNISELSKLANLEVLWLNNNPKLDFTTFDSSCWAKLRVLRLMNTNLTSLNNDYRLFVGLNQLEELSLGNNGLETLSADYFPALPKLKILFVHYNHLKTFDAQEFKRKFSIMSLYLFENLLECDSLENVRYTFEGVQTDENCNFTTPDGCGYEFFPYLSSLKTRCQMSTISDNTFAKLNFTVKKLDLSLNHIKTIESQAFAGLDELESINIRSNELTNLPLNVFESLRNITQIDLSSNSLTSFSFDVFANNQNLQIVTLNGNNMTTLVPIQHQGEFSIRELHIDNNKLTDRSELCKLRNLEIVNLDRNENWDSTTFHQICWPKLITHLGVEKPNIPLWCSNHDYPIISTKGNCRTNGR